jgi:hypothetical protein
LAKDHALPAVDANDVSAVRHFLLGRCPRENRLWSLGRFGAGGLEEALG